MGFEDWREQKKRRRRRTRKRRFLLCMALIAIIVTGMRYSYASSKKAPEEMNSYMGVQKKVIETATPKASEKVDQPTSIPTKKEEQDSTKKKAKEIYQKDKDTLILVNRVHEMDDSLLKDDGLLAYDGRIKISKVIYIDMTDMLTDASNQGLELEVVSAYRSRAYQNRLVDKRVNEQKKKGLTDEQARQEVYKHTMPAGCSEHETGLALDILSSTYMDMDETQERTEENRWLQKHCYEYGFILRYPTDKAKITGVDYEPWHFRYVGKEAAKFIMENDLTLEEFYNLL